MERITCFVRNWMKHKTLFYELVSETNTTTVKLLMIGGFSVHLKAASWIQCRTQTNRLDPLRFHLVQIVWLFAIMLLRFQIASMQNTSSLETISSESFGDKS